MIGRVDEPRGEQRIVVRRRQHLLNWLVAVSRSRKHTPYIGICVAHTAKPYKRVSNRRFRMKERADVRAGREPDVTVKIMPDPRLMAYDDKRYHADAPAWAMRK